MSRTGQNLYWPFLYWVEALFKLFFASYFVCEKGADMDILGVGVDAIVVDSLHSEHYSKDLMKNLQLNKIVIGHYQPRKAGVITTESIQDLVCSIKEQGVLQPIIVREAVGNQYEIIAGERRYRAALEANLNEIPCVIKSVSEKDAFAIALIENIQREQLSLLEESESLLKLKEEYFLSVDEVSKTVGKPRTTVANLIRVASLLGVEGKLLWEKGAVDYGHIRAVIILNHDFQNTVLQYVVENKLSVRETEKLVREKKYLGLGRKISAISSEKSGCLNEELKCIIDKFSAIHGKNASIKLMRKGRIKMSMEFENFDKAFNFLKEKYPKDFGE